MRLTEEALAERQRLFTEILPQWEGRIVSVSYFTLQTKPIDRGLLELDDIRNQLRFYVWKAVESWDPERGASLSTWIFNAINQGKSLIVESQYHKVPRDEDGRAQYPLSLETEIETDLDGDFIAGIQIEDPFSVERVTEFIEDDWFQGCCRAIRLALAEGFEKNVFDKILSSEYETDQALADELGVDFALISDVRFKAKIAFSLLNDIPLETFTRAKSAEKVAQTMRTRLAQYT